MLRPIMQSDAGYRQGDGADFVPQFQPAPQARTRTPIIAVDTVDNCWLFVPEQEVPIVSVPVTGYGSTMSDLAYSNWLLSHPRDVFPMDREVALLRPSNASSSPQRRLEPAVCLLHLKSTLPSLPFRKLFLRSHPVQSYQPFDNTPPPLEVCLRDFINRLYNFGEERVQLILGGEAEFETV